MSKALATIATQPLIVAKVGLQSRPPPSRQGKPFKTFGEVMKYIIDKEGVLSLFKGIGPQIIKGLLVQGLLMMTKERYVCCLSVILTFTDPATGWSFYSLPCLLRFRGSRRASCKVQSILLHLRPRPVSLRP